MSRVATATRSMQVLHDIMSIEQRLSKVTNQIATGRRINYFHDDPTSMSLTIGYERVSAEAGNYLRQVNAAKSWMNETDSVLQSMSVMIRRSKDLAIQGANGTNDPDSHVAIAQEITQLIDQMVALGNSQYDGRYLFSGQKTQTRPFAKTVTAFGETVEYNGDGNGLQRRVGPSSYVDISTQGVGVFYPPVSESTDLTDLRAGDGIPAGDFQITDKNGGTATVSVSTPPMTIVRDVLDAINGAGIGVFARVKADKTGIEINDISGGNGSLVISDVNNVTARRLGIDSTTEGISIQGEALYPDKSTFRTLIKFRDALLNHDFDTIRDETIGELDDALDRVTSTLAKVGAKVNRLEYTEKRLTDSRFQMDSLASSERDLDMAEGIMRLKEIESTQQAALIMGSRLLQVSLANYL